MVIRRLTSLLSLTAICVVVARAQSTAPVLSQSLPTQALAPGGPAVTIDLRNYFAVPGLAGGAVPAPYDSIFPTGGGDPLITLTVENSSAATVETFLSGSTLTLTPAAPGSAAIVVRASDPNGAAASGSFAATVFGAAPVFENQPRSQTVATGSTVVFDAPAEGAGAYRWEKNGEVIAGATTRTLVVPNASRSDAARYTAFATNALGTTAADTATLQVVDVAPQQAGRLTNLSILTTAGAGERVLTVGAVVGPLNASGSLPIVVRGVGPTLAQAPFNVGGVLADPVMNLFVAGATAPAATNDDWGGGETLRAAFESVGAFALPPASADSALLRNAPGAAVGGHTVQISAKDGASGMTLAEIYDATGTARTAATPRLINVSTLTRVAAGSDLTVGFVLVGQTARTVLVRGVGPSLARLGVDGVMLNPKLDLFDNATGRRIGSNDDWGGALEISSAGGAVGAFALAGGTSKDAAILVTLPPGPYSARVSDAQGQSGTVIVEVYEVP